MMDTDKLRELERYDRRAQLAISSGATTNAPLFDSSGIKAYLNTPYQFYEQKIFSLIQPEHRVLELAAGTGNLTFALLQTGAEVVATDISQSSLLLLKKRFDHFGKLKTEIADLEKLPFLSASFDVVTCAGGLSYGDPQLVQAEIMRVLRPDGMLICVDSLNNNPIYRLNRWIQFLRNNRTKSTFKRMPDLNYINQLRAGFHKSSVDYFGAMTFAMPFIAPLMGESVAKTLSDRIDKWLRVKRAAFKFVFVGNGKVNRNQG